MLCCELDSSASQEKTGPTHLFSSRWPVRLGEWCQGQGWPGHQATLGGTVPLRRARCRLASLTALLIFAESGVPVSNHAEVVSDARGDGLRNEATSARWSHTCWDQSAAQRGASSSPPSSSGASRMDGAQHVSRQPSPVFPALFSLDSPTSSPIVGDAYVLEGARLSHPWLASNPGASK